MVLTDIYPTVFPFFVYWNSLALTQFIERRNLMISFFVGLLLFFFLLLSLVFRFIKGGLNRFVIVSSIVIVIVLIRYGIFIFIDSVAVDE